MKYLVEQEMTLPLETKEDIAIDFLIETYFGMSRTYDVLRSEVSRDGQWFGYWMTGYQDNEYFINVCAVTKKKMEIFNLIQDILKIRKEREKKDMGS